MATKRIMILSNTIVCYFAQMLLCVMICLQLLGEIDTIYDYNEFILLMYARFICTIILHLALLDEVRRSVRNIKYAINHPYMFHSWFVAYLVGFMQASATIFVEIISVIVICLQQDPMDIVFNFIALSVITQFDDFIYESFEDCLKELVKHEGEPILCTRHTTSRRCNKDELSIVKDDLGRLRPMRINFEDRELLNKVCYVVYKVMRTFYVSFYFYFMPFTTIVLSVGLVMFCYEPSLNIPNV